MFRRIRCGAAEATRRGFTRTASKAAGGSTPCGPVTFGVIREPQPALARSHFERHHGLAVLHLERRGGSRGATHR